MTGCQAGARVIEDSQPAGSLPKRTAVAFDRHGTGGGRTGNTRRNLTVAGHSQATWHHDRGREAHLCKIWWVKEYPRSMAGPVG